MKNHPFIHELAIYRAMSEHMPKWVYFYLPPVNPVGHVAIGPNEGFLKYPVVLNQGKALYFIEPKRGRDRAATAVMQ